MIIQVRHKGDMMPLTRWIISTNKMKNILKIGSKGDLVTQIQQFLNQKGYICVVDGKFGAKTAQQVSLYQSANNLVVDGQVGPITWGRMFNGDSISKIDIFCHAIQDREGF